MLLLDNKISLKKLLLEVFLIISSVKLCEIFCGSEDFKTVVSKSQYSAL